MANILGRFVRCSSRTLWKDYSHFKRVRTSSTSRLCISRRSISILENADLIQSIPLEDVRNFCFIAHVDHGKSSLSSRVLELTGNLGPEAQKIAQQAAAGETLRDEVIERAEKERIELLDTLSVEQERGITVKASTATMLYPHPSAVGPNGVLLLNMIDTPGHVDFGKEVARSLSFVQGAILLLDASQGIQAQTWSVYERAKSMADPPELIVALTKVDLDAARPIHVALQVAEWLDMDDPDSIVTTSARNRYGIKELLDTICSATRPPKPLEDDIANYDDGLDGSILRAQVVDSWYDSRGVNCLVQIVSGQLKEGDRISIVASPNEERSKQQLQQSYPVQEVGLVLPQAHRTGQLGRGQMGYVRFGLRDPRQAQPGTILIWNESVGKEMILPSSAMVEAAGKSVLYASVHPEDEAGFEDLCHAVDRLALNDTGLEVTRTSAKGGATSSSTGGGPFLAPGLRVGFQGLLHVEVFRQRLLDEFNLSAVVTPPKVPYVITTLPGRMSKKEPETKVIEDLADWPEQGIRFKVEEPVVDVRIMAPMEAAGAVMELMQKKRGEDLGTQPIDEDIWLYTARIPWAEVVVDFHDQLKNVTAGYGSMDTSEANPPYQEADLVKVEIMLNGDVVHPLAFVCHSDNAQSEAREVCKKLQSVLPRRQFVVIIQAKASGKIIASERIKAYRKDVLTKSGKVVGGGDSSRKKKLLEKQKKGKKLQQQSGRVTLSQAAFNTVISRS